MSSLPTGPLANSKRDIGYQARLRPKWLREEGQSKREARGSMTVRQTANRSQHHRRQPVYCQLHPRGIRVPGRGSTHLPIESLHPHAVDAALAAKCASLQVRFEVMSDTLYAQ